MLVAVGGHSRNIGKTSVVAGLIRALPQWNWTAMKITQFGHGICSVSGESCDCCLEPECPYAIAQEHQPDDSDTGRFLAAGARLSYWVRTAAGQLENALPAIRDIYAASHNLIVESNSIVEFYPARPLLGGVGLRTSGFQNVEPAFSGAGGCLRGDRARHARAAVEGRGTRRLGGVAALCGASAAICDARTGGVCRSPPLTLCCTHRLMRPHNAASPAPHA